MILYNYCKSSKFTYKIGSTLWPWWFCVLIDIYTYIHYSIKGLSKNIIHLICKPKFHSHSSNLALQSFVNFPQFVVAHKKNPLNFQFQSKSIKLPHGSQLNILTDSSIFAHRNDGSWGIVNFVLCKTNYDWDSICIDLCTVIGD
jgi:hypothetical protein